MPAPGLTLKCYRLRRPPDELQATVSDAAFADLPVAFVGYQRSDTQYMIMAVRDTDEIVVGMGIGWLFEQTEKEPLLWIGATEVNEPYRNAGLERELIEALAHFTLQEGAGKVFIADKLGHYLSTAQKH